MNLGSIKTRYALWFTGFMVIICILTVVGIRYFVFPKLEQLQTDNISMQMQKISHEIKIALSKIESQSRTITQTIPNLDSDEIDKLLPALIDQYGDRAVFGGGIWPLPNKRKDGVDRFSSFYVREDGKGKLVKSDYWNSKEAPNYYDEGWHKTAFSVPKGTCQWWPAYADAGFEARTNCAMAIYKNGEPYGVSTIDLTLGFFNKLVAELEKEIRGEVLIIENNGKVVSNSSRINEDIILKSLSEIPNDGFVSALRSLQMKDGLASEPITHYEMLGEPYTLMIQKVEGTPWYVAAGLPTSLITAAGNSILKALAGVQIPLVVILLCFVILAIRGLVKRLTVLGENLDRLSSGDADLTQRIKIVRDDEIGNIGNSVNRFILELQNLVTDVVDTSVRIRDGVSNIQSQTKDNNSALRKHSSETEQAVTAINEMHSASAMVANDASSSANFALEVNGNTQQTRNVVEAASIGVDELTKHVDTAMDKVRLMKEDTNAITSVLSVIQDIAEQTNLLALNAAIEAARAGEQGRGFAVVADEVRTLASRTQKSTLEISEMLSRMQKGVESVVNAMEETITSSSSAGERTREVHSGLDHVANAMTKISELSIQIATAAEEQSSVSDEINRNMVAIQELVRLLVENGHKSETVTNDLVESNTRLTDLMSRFKV